MKASCNAQIFLIGLFLGLLCLQVPCLANDTPANSADSNNRVLQSSPTHYYSLVKEETDSDGTRHIFAEYKGNQASIGNSEIIKNIEMIVSFHDKNTFRVKIVNKDTPRWEIPEKAPFPHFTSNNRIKEADSCCEVLVQNEPFGFSITRKDTHEVIFDTKDKEFIFSNYLIQLQTSLPSQYVYGFGERNYKFKLESGIYTIWGRDDPMVIEDGSGGGNTYSHHPVGLVRDQNKNFFLTLMRNSNAMDVIIKNDNNNKPSLTYKMVGGVVDLIFFVGDNYPETVLKSYHSYLGKFTMMPFWSMGYHQSKWGYTNVDIMSQVVDGYKEHGLPLDVIWSDIDYMINKEIFTVDETNFPLDRMKEMIKTKNKKWVPIIDPGVRRDNTRGPGAKEGIARNVLLKNYKGLDLVGYVWPGPCYFPDFFHPDSEKYWFDMLEILYNKIPFSGIWLDMNEIANFANGEHGDRQDTKLDQIPYTPGKNKLKHKTISLDAVHSGGILEYDTHSLFSLMENEVTYKYLQTKSKLPFILTRGTTMGVGKFATHWSGDNGAHWNFLKDSIPGNFNFQIFGIPFVGADICGFMDGTNEELCARWTQVGALYPFARNHHEEKTRNQEPWTFTGHNHGVSIIETTRASLRTRYAILKWYYSLFIETQGTGSIFRPMMFEFPLEDELYKDGFGDYQFLLGRSVLCTPKVESGDPTVDAYFPQATWYELFTGHKVMDKKAAVRTKKVEASFNASAPLFLRGGHIVHRQNVDNVLSTQELNNEFELIVALDRETEQSELSAKGTMMGIEKYDDDSVYDRCMEGNNCLYNINITVLKEDAASVSVKIDVKRQEDHVRVSLDGFGLYGLKLYGLPLDFMEEDESRIGYGLVHVERAGQTTLTLDLVELVEIGANAFQITFETPLKVTDGDTVKLELFI